MADTCGKKFLFGEHQECVRPPGHLGLHRDTIRIRRMETTQWGDNESERQ